jgi:hypothetical protein
MRLRASKWRDSRFCLRYQLQRNVVGAAIHRDEAFKAECRGDAVISRPFEMAVDGERAAMLREIWRMCQLRGTHRVDQVEEAPER